MWQHRNLCLISVNTTLWTGRLYPWGKTPPDPRTALDIVYQRQCVVHSGIWTRDRSAVTMPTELPYLRTLLYAVHSGIWTTARCAVTMPIELPYLRTLLYAVHSGIWTTARCAVTMPTELPYLRTLLYVVHSGIWTTARSSVTMPTELPYLRTLLYALLAPLCLLVHSPTEVASRSVECGAD